MIWNLQLQVFLKQIRGKHFWKKVCLCFKIIVFKTVKIGVFLLFMWTYSYELNTIGQNWMVFIEKYSINFMSAKYCAALLCTLEDIYVFVRKPQCNSRAKTFGVVAIVVFIFYKQNATLHFIRDNADASHCT